MKKVIIAIADIGGGHMAPAQALQSVFEEKYKGQFEVEIVDVLKLIDAPPFNTGDYTYNLMTNNWTLEYLNNFLFRLGNFIGPVWEHMVWGWTLTKAVPIIDDLNADIIISNHPVVTNIIKGVKLAKVNFIHVAQITDAERFLHTCMDTTAEAVIAPTYEAKSMCTKHGVRSERVIYPFFPLRKSLQNFKPKQKVLKELGFTTKKPVILVATSGLGMESLTKVAEELSKNDQWQLIILAGKVQTAVERLQKKYGKLPHVQVFGFVDNIQDYYNVADLVIGKPGMSTVFEAEAFKKKTILTHPVALQERGNVEYALRSPLFRFIDRDWSKLVSTVTELLSAKIATDYQPRQGFDGAEKIVDEIVKRFG